MALMGLVNLPKSGQTGALPESGGTMVGNIARLVGIRQVDSAITGTANFVSGNATVTGTGTKFLSEVRPGDRIYPNTQSTANFTVKSIQSDTQLTLINGFPGTTANGATITLQR